MATASDITMLREISAAGDRGRTGALDVEWDGARVTLFFMFGHPSHVVFETADGRHLAGETALDAFVAELPDEFRVAPWRRAMVTDDTLHYTAEDLMGLFQRRTAPVESNGQVTEPSAPEAAAAPDAAGAPPPAETALVSAPPALAPPPQTEQPPFGLHDFPLLPLATTLWTDAAANVIGLEPAVPRLPDSFVVLSGPTCQGVALIEGGRVTDAVWVNPAGGSLGDPAAHALMNSLEGTLTAYRADDPRLLSALPMLWRAPRLAAGLPGAWLHIDDIVAEIRTSARSCALVVESADRGVALFSSGELVAVFTAGQRWPATSMAALRGLLHEGGALVTVLGQLRDDTPMTETGDAPVPAATEQAGDDEPSAPAVAETETVAPEAALTAAVDADEVTDHAAEAAGAELTESPAAAESATTDVGTTGEIEPTDAADTTVAADTDELPGEPRGRGRRGRGRQDTEVIESVAATPVEGATPIDDEPAAAQTDTDTDVPAVAAEEAGDTTTYAEAQGEPAEDSGTETVAGAGAVDEFQYATPAAAPADALHFEPAVFTIADLPTGHTAPEPEAESAADPTGMAGVEAREATEFVPARLEIDVDSLRSELTDIATVWLGADDAAPVAQAIGAARPGVDDFVSTIRAIGAMEIPGHESAVVRAMAREMHYRASEVLCGV